MKKYHKSIEKLNQINDNLYIECISDLIEHADVSEMSNFIQHAETTCLDHCIEVSYRSYKIAKLLKVDYRSAARGGLLHDFFLYDWHIKGNRRGLHGLTHPKTAHNNARQRFTLNKVEKDIILRHMWPLTPKPPKYIESLIVILVDKYCAALEIIPTKSRNEAPEY